MITGKPFRMKRESLFYFVLFYTVVIEINVFNSKKLTDNKEDQNYLA